MRLPPQPAGRPGLTWPSSGRPHGGDGGQQPDRRGSLWPAGLRTGTPEGHAAAAALPAPRHTCSPGVRERDLGTTRGAGPGAEAGCRGGGGVHGLCQRPGAAPSPLALGLPPRTFLHSQCWGPEGRGLRVPAGRGPPEAPGLWPHGPRLRLRGHVASPLCLCDLSVPARTRALGPTGTQDDSVSILIFRTSARTLILNRSHAEVADGHELGGTYLTHGTAPMCQRENRLGKLG